MANNLNWLSNSHSPNSYWLRENMYFSLTKTDISSKKPRFQYGLVLNSDSSQTKISIEFDNLKYSNGLRSEIDHAAR